MTALEGQPTATAPEGPASTARPSGGRPPSSGRRMLARVALAVAILATGGVAVGYLVSAPAGTATQEAPPPPSAAAPAPAPAPQPAAPAPAAPAPALTDTSGAPLPAPVASATQQVTAALASGDVAAIQPVYVPGRAVRAAPWPTVATLLADPANRAGLVAALQTPPTRTPDGWRYTSPTGNQVGIDPQGHVSFIRLS